MKYMLLMYSLASAVLFPMFVGCSDRVPPNESKPPSDRQPTEQVSDRQLIRRAVYLGLIACFSGDRTPPKVFFLSLDPGEERDIDTVYKAFSVRPSSECVVDQKGVRARTTGEQGVFLEVKRLEITGTSAEVYAGIFDGAGVGYTFRLQKKDGAWTVTEKKMLWVE